jgi:hypothetical protein
VLADGTRISYANALSKTGVWPFYQGNTNGFAVTGPVTFRDTPDVGDLDGLSLAWFRAAGKASLYPAGWPAGIRVDLIGSKYHAPGAGLPIFNGLPPADDDGNAVLTLTDGGLPEAGMVQPLNIDQHARARVISASSRTSVRINPATGLISGKFTHPVIGRATRFQGAVLQKQARASGAFRTKTEVGGLSLMPR